MGGSHCFPSTVFPTCSGLEGGFFLIVVQTPTVPVAKPMDSSSTAMIFVVVPTLVFFLSSLKGSRGADKAWGAPSVQTKGSILSAQAGLGEPFRRPCPVTACAATTQRANHQRPENPQGAGIAHQALAFQMLPTRSFPSLWLCCLL